MYKLRSNFALDFSHSSTSYTVSLSVKNNIPILIRYPAVTKQFQVRGLFKHRSFGPWVLFMHVHAIGKPSKNFCEIALGLDLS
jgi:hypothetical protein